ncbi:MAG TPA: PLP-dependent aminotransferase family protein [Thermoanaerobaculia bacterium]|nr:PLP-dependent aminotransferase family protein [Thermoanaerobaculia bacterium]
MPDPKDDLIEELHRLAAGKNPGLAGVQDLLERPGLLSLAADLPAPELFPMNDVAQAAERLIGDEFDLAEYGVPYLPLKARIVELMAVRGIRCRQEQVVLTTGTQAALDLLGRLLLDPGSQIVVEETVYDGVLTAVRHQEPHILTVSTDAETGIDVDQVESLLAQGARPAFLYSIPEGHNPLGVSLSLEKRLRLVDLARKFGVPILEDDAYGFLSYDGHPEPPLRALDESWVVYLGSFSMILAPALRAGWMVLPDELAPRLSMLPGAAELDVASFSHRTISAWLEAGYLPEHLETVRAAYRRRRDILVRALEEHLPKEVRWHRPSSGLFVWVELPPGMDSTALLHTAVETESVSFAPGSVFAVQGRTHAARGLRLSFGNNPPHRIEEAVHRLARAIQSSLPR